MSNAPAPFDRYSDEWLVWAAQFGSPGDKNSAPYFMAVRPDQRLRVAMVAGTIQNTSPGWNYSGAVAEAVRRLKAVDVAETDVERYARKDRERQQAEREARFAAEAAWFARQQKGA